MTKTPWHLWVVGVLALLWNAGGAFDYVMTQTRNADYLAAFTPDQLDFFFGFPVWVDASWAIAVWAAVLGSILLLLRSRFAVPVFWISLAAMLLTAVHNFVLSEVSWISLMGVFPLIFTIVIAVVTILLVLYARAMTKRGVLK